MVTSRWRPRRRRLGALVVAAAFIAGATAARSPQAVVTGRFLSEAEALARPNTVVETGTQTTQYSNHDSAGITFDMRGWESTAYHESETSYPLILSGADNTYVIGPTVTGSNPSTWTWQRWEQMDVVGGGLWFETTGRSAVYGYRAHDVFDYFKPRPTVTGDTQARILIADSYGSGIHDDCIENDYEMNVVVRRTVCNGAHMGISLGQDSETPGVVTTVTDSTIILRPRPNEKAADGKGHAVLFKFVGGGSVNMHRVNACYTENPLEDEKLTNWPAGTYDQVTVVLGHNFTLPLSSFGNVPAGVTFSRDWSICSGAVTQWFADHGSGSLASSPALATVASGSVNIAAAGDIGDGSCCDQDTAALISSRNPRAVLTLGDNQYPDGALSDFLVDYDASWGVFKGRTYPAPGNHDYHTTNAQGFYDYFGTRAPSTYYSYKLAGWRLLSMNNYVSFDSQTAWLTSKVALDPVGTCQIAYWHEPRWSSGSNHGSDSGVQDWWAAAVASGVDIVLNGHDHEYERFAKLDANGQPSASGTREFVVGTGGAGPYSFGTPLTGSRKRIVTYGALFITLNPTSYSWRFRDTTGAILDAGTTSCH